MFQWFFDCFPYTIEPSSPFCLLEVGDLFQERDGLWLLLYRDAVKVKVVKMTWIGRLIYGGKIGRNPTNRT